MLYRPGLVGRMPCPMDWYAGSGPPTISDDFSAGVAAGWTFTRTSANATNCLYSDSPTAPALTTYAANVPRVLDFGLLMEPQRTNLFLNSEAPVTQSIAVTNGTTYTVWCHGTGNVALSGMGASGAVVAGTPIIFTANASGNVVCTCTAPLTRVQFEAGPGPSSYIQSGATAQTRTEDRLNKNYLGGQLNANEGTYWIEWSAQYPVTTAGLTRLFVAGTGSYSSDANTDQGIIFSGSPYVFSGVVFNAAASGVAQSAMFGPRPLGAVSRTAVSVSQHRCKVAQDYALDVNPPPDPNYRPPTLLAITLFGGGNNVPMNGFLRGFKYWPVAMPDAELKECTGAGYYGGPPIFDVSFMGGANAFPRRWLHTRGAATGVVTDSVYDDAPGSTFNTYSGSTPRMTPRGLLLDGSHSNLFPNGTNPVTGNSGNLGVQTYCCWMIGTGSVAVTPNTAVGTGFGTVTQGNPIWIVTTGAGTVTCTMSGSVNRFAIEQQGGNPAGAVLPRAYLQATASNQVSGGEFATIPAANWYNNEQGTYVIDFAMLGYTSSWFLFSAWSGSDNANREQIFNISNAPAVAPTMNFRGNTIAGGGNLGGVDSPPVVGGVDLIASRVHRIALSVGPARRVNVLNGQPVKADFPTGSSNVVAPRPAYPTLFGIGTDSTVVGGVGRGNGYYRRVRYYDYAMTDDQLIALTGAASLDLSFMSGTLDSRITFTRASVATCYDATGALLTIGSGSPRFDYDPVTHAPLGLMLEEARTNSLLNSAALSTQSVTVTAQAYALSFYGTGTVTLSGAATGTLVGTGAAPNRASMVFTPTAGTLTLTVTGSVQNAQLEAGGFATSYIPTTGATVTRAAEVASIQTAGAPWYAPGVGSLVAEGMRNTPASTINLWWAGIGTSGTAANEVGMFCSGALAQGAQSLIRSASSNIYNKSVAGGVYNNNGVVSKTGITWQPGLTSWAINRSMQASAEAITGPIPTLNQLTIGCRASGFGQLNGYIRRLRYWDRPITDAELITATT